VVQIVPLQLGPMLAWAALARAQARRTAERAAAWAAPQWRDHAPARVLVTQTATWCQVHGAWQSFAHTDLTRYWLHPDTTTDTHTDAVVLESGQWAPRALTGPAAWTHAVLLAYLHPMGEDWRDAPWLGPVRDRLREP